MIHVNVFVNVTLEDLYEIRIWMTLVCSWNSET